MATVKTRDAQPLPDNIEENTQKIIDRTPGKLDKKKAIAMVKGGMSMTEVAQEFGVCKQAVSQLMKRVQDNKPQLQEYQDKKAEVFEQIQSELLSGVDREKIKAASAQQLVTSAAILQDKIQTLRGQPVSIADVNIRGLIAHLVPSSVTEMDTESVTDAEYIDNLSV